MKAQLCIVDDDRPLVTDTGVQILPTKQNAFLVRCLAHRLSLLFGVLRIFLPADANLWRLRAHSDRFPRSLRVLADFPKLSLGRRCMSSE